MAHSVNLTNDLTETVTFLVLDSKDGDEAFEKALAARQSGMGNAVACLLEDTQSYRDDAYIADPMDDLSECTDGSPAELLMYGDLVDTVEKASQARIVEVFGDASEKAYAEFEIGTLPSKDFMIQTGANNKLLLIDPEDGSIRFMMNPNPRGITGQGYKVDIASAHAPDHAMTVLLCFTAKIVRTEIVRPGLITI